ncbi:MAG: hypothetical protein U0269_33925 [Polyangiales bacterium]
MQPSRAMAEAVQIIYSDDGAALSIWRNVMISYYREQATEERMRHFRATQRELAKQPDPVGCMIVSSLHSRAKMELTEATRAAIVDAIKAYEHRDLAVAVVIEARGFLGTTVRALVSGLILLARPKYPMKIFGTLEEGAPWLIEKMRGGRTGTTASALIEAVEATGARVPMPAGL